LRNHPITLIVLLFVFSPPFLSQDRKPRDEEAAAGTEEMVKLLEDISQKTTPEMNPYANRLRAAHFLGLEKSAAPDQKLALRLQAAQELLNAGETTEAIRQFESLLEVFEQTPNEVDAKLVRRVEKLLAVSYLRLGEQDNCITNHTADSCILPISRKGVHKNQRGSRAAVQSYLSLLKDRPGDLESRWLLNVAYMTLGEYPDKVPPNWLIPEEAFRSDYELKRFTDIAPNLRIDVTGLAGGSIMEDFDGDGHLDIIASSWGLRDQVRYFRNNADGTFSDRTVESRLKGIVGGLNLVHSDYNNDGYRDVLVLRGAWLYQHGNHPNSLLRNNGDGTFTDVTKAAGLLSFHPTQTAAWGDFNNDGWLDLFVGNESTEHLRTEPRFPPSRAVERPSELYINNRDGTFTNVAERAGVDVKAFVKGVAWGDYDNDGFLDLYVSCLAGPNFLFRNLGPDGEWKFADVTRGAGVEEPFHSFPTWFWDYDNDGWLDIFASGYSLDHYGFFAAYAAAEYVGLPNRVETPGLYRNNRDGTFSDVTEDVGLRKPLFTMGCNFGDLDNDGYLDLYLGTGEPELRSIFPNRMFRNAEGKFFQDVTTSGGFGHLQKGHGVSFGDIDNDGDQDIHAVMGGFYEGDVFQNVLFENPGMDNHWLTIVLEGVESNRDGIGARIKIAVETADGARSIYRSVSTGGSFGSSPLRQEIGLGKAIAVRRIEVRWPQPGERQVFENVGLDRVIKIVEGESRIRPHQPRSR
jgi:hypothetical protein